MGLRFRKTISLFKGVNLNISKSGLGISAGVPGLRGSINTSGRVTGTVGIPGTGVYYKKSYDLKKLGKGKDDKVSKGGKEKTAAAAAAFTYYFGAVKVSTGALKLEKLSAGRCVKSQS